MGRQGNKPVALFANTCHSADIGGRILSAEAREVFEEGLLQEVVKARGGNESTPTPLNDASTTTTIGASRNTKVAVSTAGRMTLVITPRLSAARRTAPPEA